MANVKVFLTDRRTEGRTDRVITIRHPPSGGALNKRPKGPHIVHLSTMCHLFGGLASAAILFFRLARKTQTW